MIFRVNFKSNRLGKNSEKERKYTIFHDSKETKIQKQKQNKRNGIEKRHNLNIIRLNC